ncbi:hypothetical protein [Streptosporangium sp. NPDC049644]|uniref:hypothetical protein n=1 Tax=Streptosporangium sp. NPDC049644 TaxID=3155507 RepID=UPI003414DC44
MTSCSARWLRWRAGGGVAVVANGTPLWLQDTAWSRALRGCLEQWLGFEVGHACGTDEASRRRYRDSLAGAGFGVREIGVDYTDELDLDRIVGGVYSALPVDRLPAPDRRPLFAERIRRALERHRPFTEHVRVAMLVGRVGDEPPRHQLHRGSVRPPPATTSRPAPGTAR